MKDKVYVVTQEWGNTNNEDFNFEVLGVFFDLHEAVACMYQCRNLELSESYHTPYEYIAHSMEVSVNEEDWRIEISSNEGKWDNIEIHEKEIEQRDFIAIQFEYDGETFNERIYLDQIDRDHYDDHWDWWFGSHEGLKHPDLNFEVFGDKDENGNIVYDAFEINVYDNEDAMDPMATICDFELTQSWLGKKEGFIKYYDNEQS